MKWFYVLLITILPITVEAHTIVCHSYAQLTSNFQIFYKESLTHRGFTETNDGRVFILEIWQDKEYSTFSIIWVRADGVACILQTGKELKEVEGAFDEPT